MKPDSFLFQVSSVQNVYSLMITGLYDNWPISSNIPDTAFLWMWGGYTETADWKGGGNLSKLPFYGVFSKPAFI